MESRRRANEYHLPFAAYFGFTYAYSNLLAGRKIIRAREPKTIKKSQSTT
jgi:hypothetical protein